MSSSGRTGDTGSREKKDTRGGSVEGGEHTETRQRCSVMNTWAASKMSEKGKFGKFKEVSKPGTGSRVESH